MESISFILSVGCAWALCVGRWLAAAVKNHKATFPFLYFSVTKSTKSHIRERSPLLYISSRVHELVAQAMRGECVLQRDKSKVGGFAAPHDFSHTTRANTAHEEVEQIRARKPARPHNMVGGRESSTRADESKDFCQPSPVGLWNTLCLLHRSYW